MSICLHKLYVNIYCLAGNLLSMDKKPKILVIEDEAAIRNGLIDVLIFHGFDVEDTDNGTDGLKLAQTGLYELILLDVMLPGITGFEICNIIRTTDREQPIIMLTAKSSDEDIIEGLTLGADDYIAKPFSVAQLVLRIKAVLRRTHNDLDNDDHIRFNDDTIIDLINMSGNINNKFVAFTRRETDILKYLYLNHHRPVPRDELLSKLWGYSRDMDIETRTVDIHMAKLRKKIEPKPSNPQFLVTIRGAGYKLNFK